MQTPDLFNVLSIQSLRHEDDHPCCSPPVWSISRCPGLGEQLQSPPHTPGHRSHRGGTFLVTVGICSKKPGALPLMQRSLGRLSVLKCRYSAKCSSCPGRAQQGADLARGKKSNIKTYSRSNVCSLGERPVEEPEGSKHC